MRMEWTLSLGSKPTSGLQKGQSRNGRPLEFWLNAQKAVDLHRAAIESLARLVRQA